MPRRFAFLLVTAALVLAACGGSGASETTAGNTADGGGRVTDGELLGFEATAVDGSTVDVSTYAGTDLVVWFWAPW